MTIGYHHATLRYARLIDPGEKEIKKSISRGNYRNNSSELIILRQR
jgi:hypothetical protein